MTVENQALLAGEAMPKRHGSSHQAPGPQTVAKMKARQAAKIREIADALVSSGFRTLDEQAKILGLGRSTAWTILKSNHKSSGLSAKVVSRILAVRQLPPLVRTTILEYVEEKASGRYGHSAKLRRKFIIALSARRIERIKKAHIVAVTTRAERETLNVTSASQLRRAADHSTEPVHAAHKRPRSRRAV